MAEVAKSKARIGVLGASGYTGAELVRLLIRHPRVEIALLTADRRAGQEMRAVFPQFSRLVMRLDWAFPFNPVAGGPATFPGGLFLAFDQAFAMPELGAPTVMRPQL